MFRLDLGVTRPRRVPRLHGLAAAVGFLFLGVAPAAAQVAWTPTDPSPSLISPGPGPRGAAPLGSGTGLLDGSRFRFNHSLSFNYASGSFGEAGYGLWQGRLAYRLSNPLRISVDVGAVMNPSGPGPMMDTGSFFLGGFNLEYTPSRNFHIQVSYVNTPPAAVLPYQGFGSPLGWDPGRPFGSVAGTDWMSGRR